MHRLVLIACGAAIAVALQGADPDARPVDFVFNNGPEVNSLDPHVISWKHDIRVANGLFEGLMAFRILPPEPGESQGQLAVGPGVAERFEVSPDGRTYSFHLRPDARWSNGEPVTARDFAWSWQRVLTPATGADYASLLFVIQGGRAYYEALAAGRSPSLDALGIETPDERTVVVTLEAPTAYFLELTAFATFFPVYRPLLERFTVEGTVGPNGVGRYDGGWMRPGVLVSNGPFVLQSHRFKRDLVMVRNAHYWDADNVWLRQVTALAISDQNAALHAYETGQCDWLDSVPASVARALLERPAERRGEDFHRVMAFGTYFYRFNCQPTADGRANPFADPRVRRAFSLAVDRVDVARVTGVQPPVAGSLVPPGLVVYNTAGEPFEYVPPPPEEPNVAEARRLLAEAGYADGADLGPVRLMFNTGYGHELIAQRLAAIWRQTLGADVVLVPKDPNAFGEALKQKTHKEWHLGRGSWFGDYRDPSTFLDMLMTASGNNDSSYSNPEYDRLVAAAAATDDQARRMELFRQAETLGIVQEAALLPLYFYAEHSMIRPDIQGAWPNNMGYMVLKQVRRE